MENLFECMLEYFRGEGTNELEIKSTYIVPESTGGALKINLYPMQWSNRIDHKNNFNNY